MKFFTREASGKIGTRSGEAAWYKRIAEYEEYLRCIKNKLAPGWRELAEIDFHDTVIFSVERPRKSELVLRVDMSPRWQQTPKRVYTLKFAGLVNARVPTRVVGDWWLYTEVHFNDAGEGNLQALLCKSELNIIASGVACSANFEIKD